MYYTYVLKQSGKEHYYVGYTDNLKRRIAEHKKDKTRSTRAREWEIYCYFSFNSKKIAQDFEKYLKSHSGRTFSKRHFNVNADS